MSMCTTRCMNDEKFFRRWLVMGVFALCLWLPTQVFAIATVNIYSHRQQVLIKPFLAPADSALLTANNPPHLRSSDNRWFGLSERARILVISKDRVPVYGTINYEYPANSAVAAPAELASWGAFKRDTLPTERLAELAPEAQMIIDRVGW